MNNDMTSHAAYALYRCGEGVIDYTCGVLDALGHTGLSMQLKAAHAAHQDAIAARAPYLDDSEPATFGDMLAQASVKAPAHIEQAVEDTRAALDEALAKLDALRAG